MIPYRRPGAGEPPGRVALIDLGTNAVQLTILESSVPERRRLSVLEELQLLPGLGRDREGYSAPLATHRRARTMVALRHLSKRIDALGVPSGGVLAATTAAVREASDGAAFVRAVADDCGLDLRVVSGEEEAELVALAQERSFRDLCPLHLIDIGGGSTELALRKVGSTAWTLSVPTGSVKLLEAHGCDVEALLGAARSALTAGLPEPERRPLVAVGGTATTCAQLLGGLAHWDPTKLQGRDIERDELEALLARLGSMTAEQRAALPGLPAERSDVILAGAALLIAAMERFGVASVRASDRGLRYGLLWERWGRVRVHSQQAQ